MNLTFGPEDIPAHFRHKRILMVTNTPSLRALHASFLRSQGFEYVFEAGNGMHAIDMLRVQPIDLIIADWQLEELSGFNLMQTLRGSVALTDVPIIMLTTKNDLPQVKKTIDEKQTDYLIKPFKTAQLGMKIVMTLATSEYSAPKTVTEELQILTLQADAPSLTEQACYKKRA